MDGHYWNATQASDPGAATAFSVRLLCDRTRTRHRRRRNMMSSLEGSGMRGPGVRRMRGMGTRGVIVMSRRAPLGRISKSWRGSACCLWKTTWPIASRHISSSCPCTATSP
ncbi:hypothetical protein CLOM_g17410 [Closterium sp. NIES-68]|nr:hypothetical protein CLOM_g17410 [Closterium sp. NIES-68]